MSVTLATVADALIEFILSLLRDPAAAQEFDEEPEAALASRGLSNVSYADVCSVAPVVAERPAVVPNPTPKPNPEPHPDPIIREVKSIVNSFTWVDDRDTIVDQSVNQNIWANGDVTQNFDQEALVVSGDENIVAGDDLDLENNLDNSTNIDAENVNIGGEQNVTENDGSFNEATATVNDIDTTIGVDDSFNDVSSTATATDSFNDDADTYTAVDVDVADNNVVFGSEDVVIADVSTDDDQL